MIVYNGNFNSTCETVSTSESVQNQFDFNMENLYCTVYLPVVALIANIPILTNANSLLCGTYKML